MKEEAKEGMEKVHKRIDDVHKRIDGVHERIDGLEMKILGINPERRREDVEMTKSQQHAQEHKKEQEIDMKDDQVNPIKKQKVEKTNNKNKMETFPGK